MRQGLLFVCACYTHHMSKRLQVLLPDQEFEEIQRFAMQERLTVGEWVRRTLREVRTRQSLADPATKLKAVRRAAECSFPSSDMDQMLREIERGYDA